MGRMLPFLICEQTDSLHRQHW